MSLTPSLRIVPRIAVALGALVAFLATGIIIFMWPWIQPTPTYRFPIPPGTDLTEPLAIEFSKKALAADGRDLAGTLPVPYRDIGQRRKGENVYFAVNTINHNAGYVLWATRDGSYCVHLEKVGDKLVCEVSRTK
jgi:hypothetical protein